MLIENSSGNTIGGADPSFGNQFFSFALNAVRVTGSNSAANSIVNNLYSQPGRVLIDLGGDGLTPNDASPDADAGPNGLQNTPIFTAAAVLSGNSYVTGELHSAPNSTYLIQLFHITQDGSLDDSFSVTTDVTGLATFSRSLPKGNVGNGVTIFATATSNNGLGNTSEAASTRFVSGEEFVKLSGLHTAKFTDVDGDPVTITVTSGVFDFDNFALVPEGKGARLDALNLDAGFNRASVTITAAKARGGDGLVNVGTIKATGVNLDALTVDGNLDLLSLGRAGISQSLEKLTTHSLGTVGAVPSAGIFTLGGIGSIMILGDVHDAQLIINGGIFRDLTVKGNIQNSQISAYRIAGLNVGHDVVDTEITASNQGIGSIKIGGSLLEDGVGSGIHAATTIGAITVKKNIGSDGVGRISITAGGRLAPSTAQEAVAIASLKVGGSVTNFDLLAGYNAVLSPVNADVQVGAISVGGDWTASNAVAGIARGGDGFFGTSDDALIGGTPAGVISRIASIAIKGSVTGSGGSKFGFVAEEIGSFKLGRTTLSLTDGKDDLPAGSANVHVREV